MKIPYPALVLFLAFFAAQPISAQLQFFPEEIIVNASSLNLRDKPEKSGKVVEKLPRGAALSLARAIVRRAERCVVSLFDEDEVINPDLQRYLNRLSSLCFVLELLENQNAGKQTSLAKP